MRIGGGHGELVGGEHVVGRFPVQPRIAGTEGERLGGEDVVRLLPAWLVDVFHRSEMFADAREIRRHAPI